MKCVKINKKYAEKVKNELIDLKALSKDYKPVTDKEHIYFPINKEIKEYDIVEKECPKKEKENVEISSFDSIGDIIIIAEDAPDSVAEQLIKKKNIKVVLRKKGIHHGEFRTQDVEWVAGEKRKETIYMENGVRIKLNVETSYFSPRLSTERKRIADLVQDGEKVLVLFSGVAPYPLTIAKHAKPKLVVGVEKNKEANGYAIFNCRKYKNIELYNKDAKNFEYKEKFDRILMPLPKSSEDFLNVALKLIKKGGIIHFYDFIEEKNIPEESINKIKKHIKDFEVIEVVKCGQYAPRKYRICIDFRV